jgi:hypothetical protein
MSTMLGESLSLREGRRERRSSGGQTFKISRFSVDLARPRAIFDNQKRHPSRRVGWRAQSRHLQGQELVANYFHTDLGFSIIFDL